MLGMITLSPSTASNDQPWCSGYISIPPPLASCPPFTGVDSRTLEPRICYQFIWLFHSELGIPYDCQSVIIYIAPLSIHLASHVKNEQTSESMKEFTNERKEFLKEGRNEWTHEWINKQVNQWRNSRTNEGNSWRKEGTNEPTNE